MRLTRDHLLTQEGAGISLGFSRLQKWWRWKKRIVEKTGRKRQIREKKTNYYEIIVQFDLETICIDDEESPFLLRFDLI